MRGRFVPFATFAALLLAMPGAAGCGDGAEEEPTPTPTATASPTPTQGPAPTLTAPPAKADSDIALTVVSGSSQYQPTVAEFRELPVAAAQGGGPSGVTLDTLATSVQARDGALITVEGRSPDFSTIRYWRGTLAEAGSTMVVTLEEGGLALLAGSLIPESAWVHAVETISFE